MATDTSKKTTLTSDLLMRQEYLGLQTLLQPFIQHCSTQRSMMFASHSQQSLVIEGCEHPRVMTGFEKTVGEYEFSTCRVNQDIIIRKVIPKFNPLTFKDAAGVIPTYTVIYVGQKDGLVHCMDVSTYTYLHDGFGYFNKMIAQDHDMLHPGNYIRKGTKLVTSPDHDGNSYMMGFNVNVAYLSIPETTEDAFVISKSLAEKGANWDFRQVKLNIGIDTIPLDLYGDGENYKCFPDIGESVRSDGILMALRKINKSTFVSDMTSDNLRRVEYQHDEAHKAPKGSFVVDVDVFINQDAVRRMKDRDDSIYKQFKDYVKSREYYHNQIVDTYLKLCTKDGENIPIAPEFNTQVVRSSCLTSNRKMCSKQIKLYDARDPVEFITVIITYASKRKITIGTKITDRNGGKGVVSAIWDDEHMPTDDRGRRAHVIMTPPSVVNRMNPSQLYEAYWNNLSDCVVSICKSRWFGNNYGINVNWMEDPLFQKNWKKAYEFIVGYFHEFRPAYGKFIHEDVNRGNEKWMMEFTADCMNDGLYLINGFRKPNPPEQLIALAEKYNLEPTPITYYHRNQETGVLKKIRTHTPVLIGSKYMMVLGKLPQATISAVAISHVSQFETPIKPKSKHIKSQNIIGLTPMKFGEDETCILNMSIGPAAVMRLYGACATSPEIVRLMGKTLLTEDKPTNLSCLPLTTQDIINKNQNISMFNHMMSCVGYSLEAEVKK